MLVNLSSYGLGYPRQYGDRVTNIRGRGCLYEGDSLKNRYPRCVCVGGGGGGGGGGGRSIKYLLSRGRGALPSRGAHSSKYGNS